MDRRLSRGLVRLPGPSLGSESQPRRPSSADLATLWKLAGVDRLWASPSSTGDACPAGGPRPSRQPQQSLKKPGAHWSVPTTFLSRSDSGRGLSQASGVLGAQRSCPSWLPAPSPAFRSFPHWQHIYLPIGGGALGKPRADSLCWGGSPA